MHLPSSTRANVLANFAGKIISAFLAILFTPLYIYFLGIESYGLIGFYATLQASLGVLELGLRPACIRELAHHSAHGAAGAPVMRDTLRSLEVVYWGVGLLIGLLTSGLAPWIASHWLHPKGLSHEQVAHALEMMAWVIALRWPSGLYSGALMGLQQQVLLNLLLVGMAVLNRVGSILVLWLIRADIEHFFAWQLLASAMTSAAFGLAAWQVMPAAARPARYSWTRLRELLPFAVGTSSNAILGTILLQTDKLILSAMLPLEHFGYYALASMMANMVVMLVDPVYAAVYPRFSQLVGQQAAREDLVRLYHLASQIVAMLVMPAALLVAWFPSQVLFAYTGDPNIATMAAWPLAILALARMFHAMVYIPYALQLSFGWVRLSVYINIVSVCWLVPSVYLLSVHYGMAGAAVAWLVVTLGYVCVGVPLMHRTLLRGEVKKWLGYSIFIPMLAINGALAIVHGMLGSLEIMDDASRWRVGAELLGIGISALAAAVVALPCAREEIVSGYRKLFARKFGERIP